MRTSGGKALPFSMPRQPHWMGGSVNGCQQSTTDNPSQRVPSVQVPSSTQHPHRNVATVRFRTIAELSPFGFLLELFVVDMSKRTIKAECFAFFAFGIYVFSNIYDFKSSVRVEE